MSVRTYTYIFAVSHYIEAGELAIAKTGSQQFACPNVKRKTEIDCRAIGAHSIIWLARFAVFIISARIQWTKLINFSAGSFAAELLNA